jgi:hypothetical protein
VLSSGELWRLHARSKSNNQVAGMTRDRNRCVVVMRGIISDSALYYAPYDPCFWRQLHALFNTQVLKEKEEIFSDLTL